MRMYDIIAKKRDNKTLTDKEIEFVVNGYTNGEIPDYQMSAFLMAVYFNAMTKTELAKFTSCMAHSGDMIDLSAIEGIKVDKHSTGGVGDKTTLIVGPIVAACGIRVAKMSGRGLGHTGGTIDKLEAIPGFKIELTQQQFFKQVNEVGISVIGQSGNIAPADKKLYALRDVTATVSSIPLIASSIMSKKLAAGSDCILLDVKVGSGAFMKSLDEAIELATAMSQIGEENGRRTAALITNMDIPLGNAIGNATEILEVVEVLKCNFDNPMFPHDLYNVSIELSASMLFIAGKGTKEQCVRMAKDAVQRGAALTKLCQMIEAQGGDARFVKNEKLTISKEVAVVNAPQKGFVKSIDAEKVGIASMMLGAGRQTKEDVIDYGAGIILYAKTGDEVILGGTIASMYTSDCKLFNVAQEMLMSAYEFSDTKPQPQPLILAYVDKNGVVKL